jgi:hypothetical protein
VPLLVVVTDMPYFVPVEDIVFVFVFDCDTVSTPYATAVRVPVKVPVGVPVSMLVAVLVSVPVRVSVALLPASGEPAPPSPES